MQILKPIVLAARWSVVVSLPFLALMAPAAAPVDPFAEGVRPTDPLTPSAQQRTFRLPPGFEIDLVASEPQIAKPMNMAFDARGRLWVTTSYEYPFPKKPGEAARDSIKIFEDKDGDGRYETVITFADNLNIPIGILPYGQGCLAWSIPNIWYFRDTDGDGKADQRDVIFGPLGWERDTHGNLASFRRGSDGWIYGTHGFNNNSTFKARDGSTLTLNSGNTYRFRPDGSRVEQYTWGQVNPFGMCQDDRGYLYTADCHSSPIYQLIPGGYYPSFGKPDDGLGFAPTTIQHSHGSTAISGIVMIPEEGWPKELQGNLFIGNVMTSRINRDRIDWHGASPVGIEMPDFLSTEDPWFRPVDLQLGPDGALYVADFYNRIIGHYEVPLQHPGRDRERGRIWRIRYSGAGSIPASIPNFTTLSATELMAEMGSALPVRRSLALEELVGRVGMPAASLARSVLADAQSGERQRSGALWVLSRLLKLDPELLRSLAGDASPLVRIHTARAIGAMARPGPAQEAQLLMALQDKDAHVRRAAAEAIAAHPAPGNVPAVLRARMRVPADDTHLAHALKIALRNQFKAKDAFDSFYRRTVEDSEWRQVAEVALAIPSVEAADFLLRYLQRFGESPDILAKLLKHAARFAPEDRLTQLVDLARRNFAQDAGRQLELYQALRQGVAERKLMAPAALKVWATELIDRVLSDASGGLAGWETVHGDGELGAETPWVFQERRSADFGAVSLLSSLPPGGESFTGILRSPGFRVPATLTFLLAGHDGLPNEPARHENRVRLREVGTDVVLMETFAPRNDTAQSIRWELAAHEGKMARVEIVDRDAGVAYAWLAAGRFAPAVFGWPKVAPRDIQARVKGVADLADSADISSLVPKLRQWAEATGGDLQIAAAAARVLAAQARTDGLAALSLLAEEPLLGVGPRRQLCQGLSQGDVARCMDGLGEALRQSAWRVQVRIAEVLAGHPALAIQLLMWVDQSKASARLLTEGKVARLLAASVPGQVDRIAKLTGDLPKTDGKRQLLIDERRKAYAGAVTDPGRGAVLFTQSCAVCHQIGGVGNLVGPQLDGIGGRGLDRLCEDILDPNRNVDHAFHTQFLVTQDGEVVSGLPRREEGDLIVLANAAGQEFSVSKKDIKERRESQSSLMPENFGETIPPADFHHLLRYLLDQRSGGRR